MDFFPESFGKGPSTKGDLASAGDLLMVVWRDYLAHFRTYATLAALPLLAFPFMAAGTALTVVGVDTSGTVLTASPTNSSLYLALMTLGAVVVVATSVVARAGLNLTIMTGIEGKSLSLAEAIKNSRQLFWPFAGTMILLYVAVTVGFSLLFFPGVLVGTFLIFAEPAAAIEKLLPIEALKRSVRMVTGRFLAVLWRIAVGYAVVAIASLALSFPLVQLPTAVLGRAFSNNIPALRVAVVGTMLVSAVITALVLPIFVSLQVHLYSQLKKLAR